VLTVLNVPNTLTLLRIVAIPCFLILLEERRYPEALAVFVAAGLTDGLDGAIARLTHTKTRLGAFLDPAADKALLVSAFIALGFMHEVPRWLVVVVISRDVMIVAGYFMLFMMTGQTMEVRPTFWGKLSTALQLLAVTVVLVSLMSPDLGGETVEQVVFPLSGLVTAIAGLQYMYRGLVWLHRSGQDSSAGAKARSELLAEDGEDDSKRASGWRHQ
jgi:cardiolipin synthase